MTALFEMEPRKDPRMVEQAHRLTHPDLEICRVKIDAALASRVPTIHFETEPAR